MIIRMIGLAAAVLLLAACSSNPPPGAAGGINSGMSGGPGGSFAPGSQQDLAATAGDRVFFAYDQSTISSEGQQILAGSLDLARAILLARVHQESLSHERLLHLLQAADSNFADVDLRARHDVEAHVEDSIRRVLVSDRWVDHRESVALVLERCLQPLSCGEHLRGDRNVAAL